ncbi:MAG TPA: class I SAM-dependent methyltransferase [Niabella sp.]|nr:class I SAM-dependent methyltransferase [Niabella sp.]
MSNKLSKRLTDIVDALPLKDNIRILEIGCGSGAMARELSRRITSGYLLAIDRSAKAIQMAVKGSKKEMEAGKLSFRQAAVEKLELATNEKLFDIAVAVRVGALDGRHPEVEKKSLIKIAKVLTNKGKLLIDGGNPLQEIPLDEYR